MLPDLYILYISNNNLIEKKLVVGASESIVRAAIQALEPANYECIISSFKKQTKSIYFDLTDKYITGQIIHLNGGQYLGVGNV
jgi:hypothetical protein